jgi:Acetyltransferase (GNAT) domain
MNTQAIQKAVTTERKTESAEKYLVRTIEPDEWPAWDNFVRESPSGTLFHTTKWLQTTGVPFRIFGCYHQESLIGGMVVELIGRHAAGHSYFTAWTNEGEGSGKPPGDATGHMLNCPYLGVVLPPPSKKYVTTLTYHRNILSSLAGHVRDQFRRVRCTMGPEVVDMQPLIWAGYMIVLVYTYRIDLSDLDVVWSNMTDKRRNDIRKAERDGITVDSEGSIQDVLSLYKGALQSHGRAARPSNVADERDKILRRQNQCRSFVARDRSGEAVAGIYMVWDEKCAYYFMGGYGRSVTHRGAGALAVWSAIRYAGEILGLRRFVMLAAGDLPLERFTRDFGGQLTVLFHVKYDRPSFSREAKRALEKLKRLIFR